MRPAAVLIIGQALTLGLMGAFLVVPGTAVFLNAFGAEGLPYVYLMVAALGAAVSFGLTALQARLGLYQLAIGTTVLVAAAILACWAGLALAGDDRAAYPALVLFALELQLGFVFIGAQAGRAFDVQELKRLFSWIVAGFVFGFMAGGFGAAAFTGRGGEAVNLLAASAALGVALAALMLSTSRHVPEPAEAEHAADRAAEEKPPSLRRILGVPLVLSVFIYQMLSAIGTQLLEYLVYDRAAARFSGTQELAGFMGTYTAVLNLVDLVVLVAVGGFLMSRYGLRYGLSANPVIVTLIIAAAAVVALVSGPDATLFFFLVAAARIADLTLADASARTSINATFKALPARQRLAAQVGVEGVGVPLALGLTALLILGINALPGSSVTHVLIATVVVCIIWSLSAWDTFRRYRTAVVAAARRRALDGAVIDLAEPATRRALHDLVLSDDPQDVRIGASLITASGGRDTAEILARAAGHPSLEVRRAVLDHLIDGEPERAREIATALVASGAPAHVVDGLRALGRLAGPPAAGLVTPLLDHADDDVRAAAAGALLRGGGDHAGIAANLAAAAASPAAEERRHAARTIAEAGRAPVPDVILRLLGDPDHGVRAEAAAAVAALGDPQRLELLATPMDARTRARFLRACRFEPSPAFCAAVAAELARDDAPVAELAGILNAAGWTATGRDRATINRLIEVETVRIGKAAHWAGAVGSPDPALEASTSRLRRALAQEAVASGRQLCDLLALVYDRRLITRDSRVLQGRSPGDAGLALESLDVVLAPEHRMAVVAALRTAFAPQLRAGSSQKPRTRWELAATARTLARDCRFAIRPDWLLASVVALMRDLSVPRDAIAEIAALGPASEELITAISGSPADGAA